MDMSSFWMFRKYYVIVSKVYQVIWLKRRFFRYMYDRERLFNVCFFTGFFSDNSSSLKLMCDFI